MSDDAKWVLVIILPIVGALVGIVWKLLNMRIEALWDQVGRSSEEGMRKTVHYTANRGSEHGLTVGDHARRLERLERKTFNGRREDE